MLQAQQLLLMLQMPQTLQMPLRLQLAQMLQMFQTLRMPLMLQMPQMMQNLQTMQMLETMRGLVVVLRMLVRGDLRRTGRRPRRAAVRPLPHNPRPPRGARELMQKIPGH